MGCAASTGQPAAEIVMDPVVPHEADDASATAPPQDVTEHDGTHREDAQEQANGFHLVATPTSSPRAGDAPHCDDETITTPSHGLVQSPSARRSSAEATFMSPPEIPSIIATRTESADGDDGDDDATDEEREERTNSSSPLLSDGGPTPLDAPTPPLDYPSSSVSSGTETATSSSDESAKTPHRRRRHRGQDAQQFSLARVLSIAEKLRSTSDATTTSLTSFAEQPAVPTAHLPNSDSLRSSRQSSFQASLSFFPQPRGESREGEWRNPVPPSAPPFKMQLPSFRYSASVDGGRERRGDNQATN